MTSRRNFSNWLQAYTEFTLQSESPLSFHFWSGVAAIAGALRRKVWIDEVIFKWTPNFYIVLVGPPGIAAKSTSMDLALDLLRDIEGVSFGPDSVTWQALGDALDAAKTLAPVGVDEKGDTLHLPMACITCAISELGTFLRPDDKDLVNVLTDLWDGKFRPWRRRTRQQGEVLIENPWINMIGCTTPSWIRENIPESMIGGGLVSRIIFVYGDQKRKLMSHPSRFIDRAAFAEAREKLVEDLAQIAELAGEYRLDDDAFAFDDEQYQKHWTEPRPLHMASDRYSGYFARKQTMVNKLAMIIAASKRNEMIITLEDMQWAHRMINAIESDMSRVFQAIGLSDTAKQVYELIVFVRAHGEIPRRELLRQMSLTMSAREFKDATETAIAAGYVKQFMRDGQVIYAFVKESGFK